MQWECNVMTAKNLNNLVAALAGRNSSEDFTLLLGTVIRVWPQDLHRIVQGTKMSYFAVASAKFPQTGARPLDPRTPITLSFRDDLTVL